jgi:hypothetical protein
MREPIRYVIAAFVLSALITMPACRGSHNPDDDKPGAKGVLNVPNDTPALLAATKVDDDALNKAAADDDTTAVQVMIAQGSVFSVPSGTTVEVIDRSWMTVQVRILDGPARGKTGWVSSKWVVESGGQNPQSASTEGSTITADELSSDARVALASAAGNKAWRNKYLSLPVNISGTVDAVRKVPAFTLPCVYLKTASAPQIVCTFSDGTANAHSLTDLKVGQRIVVQGSPDLSRKTQIYVWHCSIVSQD